MPEQKDITVQKQWDDSIQHPDVTVLLYQMQTNRNTGTSTTILYDTQTLNDTHGAMYLEVIKQTIIATIYKKKPWMAMIRLIIQTRFSYC